MTSVIIFLLFTMLEILNVIAQEGSIPKETCKIFQYDLQHGFIEDPKINLEKLTANKETIEGLRRFITSEERCSIVTDIRIFDITYNNKPVGIIPITYTEIIKLQVSANKTIEKPRDRVTKLAICFDAVSTAVAADANFRNSLRLNISGTLNGLSLTKGIVVDDKSCCHVIYEQLENINQCCKPNFIEDGEDNCACPKGKFLNKTNCDACPENTYQPNSKSSSCLACPNGTTTYGETGADRRSFCLKACPKGQFLKNNISCNACPEDTYQPNPTRRNCLQCPNGKTTYRKTGADSRSSCLTACLPGQSYNETSQNCTTCPKNTYQPLGGELDCINCEDDTITKKPGSTRREDCVESCPKGSFYSFAKSACELCPKNFFQTQEGQFNCTSCQSGKVTVSNGTKVEENCLTNCSQGLFFNQTKQKCEECPHHTYQPKFGTIKCLSCPDGGRTLNTSSTMLGDCSKNCSAGLFHNFTSRQCESCPLHYYQPKPGQTSCISCRDSKITIKVATKSEKDCMKACSAGNYYDNTMEVCKVCPLNSYQPSETATSCILCPNNRITRETGATNLTECISVTAETDESSEEDLTLMVAIPVVLTVLVVSACLLLLCFYRRWRKESERRMSAGPLNNPRRRTLTDPEMGQRSKLNSIASNHHYKMKGTGLIPDDPRPSIRIANIPKELEIPREKLRFLGQVLGKGNFGKVEKAILLKDDRTEHVVAVKMIKGGGTFSDEKELFDELEMLASLYPHPHPNIVNLIGGCTTNNGPLFVVVEYCGEGNLLKYLQKNQIHARPKQEYVNISPKAEKPGITYAWKLQKALEICHGMAHLAKFKIIHRDVAARNVLLDEKWVAKISDFGMARDIYVKQIYRKDTEGFLPVRWMAIESLESFIYNTQSDIWSFGILLWEIMSDGRVPYNNILDHTQLLNYIKSGRIMKRPKNCPKDLYHIMEKCWAKNPTDRPAFESLKDALEVLYENEAHKEDALPQRILRKFSSRRKKRRNEDDVDNPGGKTRAKKTFSNSSGKKISKIEEEEPNWKKGSEAEEQATKIEIFDLAEDTVNNEFENQGYLKSASSISEEHDGSKTSPNVPNENTFELNTISETPVSVENEEIQDSSHDNTNDDVEKTLSNNADVSMSTLMHDIENELKATTESVENNDSSSIPDELIDARERIRMSATDC